MGEVVGSAEFELRARRDQLKKDLDDAERDLKQWGDRAEGTAQASAGGIGRATKLMAAGVAALTAAFTAGLAMALQFGQASLKMADTLENSARRIGISTTALQEWQYVARKTGEDAGSVSGALETFANKFEQASAGISKQSLDAFKAIGFDQPQLRSFASVEDALDAVIDRIGELSSASDRAAIAEKLGLGPLATALQEGADEVARLRDEAAALGFVLSEEVIAKGAAAQGQLEDLAQVIGIQMAEAFINLSDEVIAFSGHVADAIKKLNEFSASYSEARQKQVDEGQSGDLFHVVARMFEPGFTDRLPWVRRRRQGYPDAAAAARNTPDDNLRDPDDPEALWRMSAEDVRRLYWGSPHSGRSALTPVQPRGRQDNSAQRAAEREERRAERVEQEIFRARQRLLQVAEQDVLTAQQRFELAQSQLRMEREARDAEIESKAARGEIKAAERRSLEAANAEADALEDRIVADNAFREVQDERLANERLLADLTADLISLQSGAARTAAERRRLELELLEITQQQRRDALRLELDRNPSLTAQQRADAMAANGRIENAERAAVNRSTMSPLEAWRDESLKTADEIAEAYETVAARGLDALNDGITDAIMNSRDLGEVFTNVANSIIADLARIAIRQSITEPLANWMFGNGKTSGSGAGNLFSSIGSWFGRLPIPGFSAGVSNFSGGLAYVHQGEVLANLAPGTDVIPAHKVGRGGGDTYQFSGNLLTPEWWAMIQSEINNGETRANSWSTKHVPGLSQSQTAKQQQYTVGRKKR